jgi:hypothetical protein
LLSLAPLKSRLARLDEQRARRQRQVISAYHFLVTGSPQGNGVRPPWGDEWNRDYNPGPAPDDQEFYLGTGVGLLYGIEDEDHRYDPRMAATLAGWNIVRGRKGRA